MSASLKMLSLSTLAMILGSAILAPGSAIASDTGALLVCEGTLKSRVPDEVSTWPIRFSLHVSPKAIDLSGASFYDTKYPVVGLHGDVVVFQKASPDGLVPAQFVGNINRVTGEFSFDDFPKGLFGSGRLKREILAQCQPAKSMF